MAIQWREMRAPISVPSIAGRTDGPPESSGDAAAAVVQFIVTGLNSYTVNRRITQELAGRASFAESQIPASSHQGVLAVADIEVRTHPATQMQEFIYQTLYLVGPPYNHSDWLHAYRQFQHAPRLESGDQHTYRFFWGTRS